MEAAVKKPTKDTDDLCHEDSDSKNKQKNRGKKRKRMASDSSDTGEDILPDNMLQLENKVHASAVKNNLDDICVRKILKKVVTNNRVLALVKLQEEKEGTIIGKEDKTVGPKLTRAKVRELMKVSPNTAWNLDNLELTPIKHIPVKTRPEVEALIAQELQEDEDDEEYEPTHEDVLSDDDNVLESCSDIDSQPRTPATPKSQRGTSPKVVTDGPFKVPQEITTSAKRKLELEEEAATIALRTRSKLSLSSTSIEHIESTFIPPDDLPNPETDDLWNQFLEECLNPASTSKNEDDDETDPEYNVAADPDAHEEDEEALGHSIIKISKKELNDLVTELFHIMPDATVSEDLAENLANTVLTENTPNDISHWDGKQEPVSDDDEKNNMSDRITFEKASFTRLSIGKTEPEDLQKKPQSVSPEKSQLIQPEQSKSIEHQCAQPERSQPQQPQSIGIQFVQVEIKQVEEKGKIEIDIDEKGNDNKNHVMADTHKLVDKTVNIKIVETEDATSVSSDANQAPLSLRILTKPQEIASHTLEIKIGLDLNITPEQILILQQQIRQHIQLATSNFLQLYVHPQYWSYAPAYKKYLETFMDLTNNNPETVVNVCNLKPAMELATSWANTVSEDTPENIKLVQFIQGEVEKNRRNAAQNHLYVGDFPYTFKEVVANSTVFLYPHLLPPIPYRADNPKKRNLYLQSEDSLIALGLDQFCKYVEANPDLFKPRFKYHKRHRIMLSQTVHLIAKHMFPWMTSQMLHSHISNVKKSGYKANPIYKFFKNGGVEPVQHKLLSYNPALTVYEQPEIEMPQLWLKHLSKRSKRFSKYLRQNKRLVKEPEGIPVAMNHTNSLRKDPLPIDFTKEIPRRKNAVESDEDDTELPDRVDVHINTHANNQMPQSDYKHMDPRTAPIVTPLNIEASQTSTVSCVIAPISTPAEVNRDPVEMSKPESCRSVNNVPSSSHCTCCYVLRKICKRQTTILEYFKRDKVNKCFCSDIKYPRLSNRLKMLISNYKYSHNMDLFDLDEKLKVLDKLKENSESVVPEVSDLEELEHVLSYQVRLINRITTLKNVYLKMRVKKLFANYNLEKDPVLLAAEFGDMCGVELVDLYIDFIGFLTAEQADSMGMFKHYFTTVCARILIKKVKEEVKREDHLKNILIAIRQVFSDYKSTACVLCTRLIESMKEYPRLAEYVFKLFPHRKQKSSKEPKVSKLPDKTLNKEYLEEKLASAEQIDESSARLVMDCEPEHTSRGSEPVMQATPDKEILDKDQTEANPPDEPRILQIFDYKAKSCSSSEEDTDHVKSIVNTGTEGRHLIINPLTIASHNMDEHIDNNSDSEEIDQKPETQDFDTEFSMVIVCEEEDVKYEPVEWKRDEDKLILEVLNQFLTPNERKNKTVLEIISENNLFELLSETLLHKSKEDVKDRVLYLLNILINEDQDCK